MTGRPAPFTADDNTGGPAGHRLPGRRPRREVISEDGIGATTYEPPYLVEGAEHLLVPGMCFSVEPGIYLPGPYGVRIEDTVTVTEDGGRRLNNTTREMAVVD